MKTSLSLTASSAQRFVGFTSCWSTFTSFCRSWILCCILCWLVLSSFSLLVCSAEAKTVLWLLCYVLCRDNRYNADQCGRKPVSPCHEESRCSPEASRRGWAACIFQRQGIHSEAAGVAHRKRPDTADRIWVFSAGAAWSSVFLSSSTKPADKLRAGLSLKVCLHWGRLWISLWSFSSQWILIQFIQWPQGAVIGSIISIRKKSHSRVYV